MAERESERREREYLEGLRYEDKFPDADGDDDTPGGLDNEPDASAFVVPVSACVNSLDGREENE